MNRLWSMDVSARGFTGALLAVSVIALIFPLATSAQVQTGTPPFASFGGGPDAVNLADLNDHWTIPVLNKAGRGTNFTYDLSYDSAVWYKTQSGSSYVWQPVFNWGWTAQTEVQTGYISYSRVSYNCDGTQPPYPQYVVFSRFVYHDQWGISHPFTGQMMYDPKDCLDGTTSSMTSQVNDGTGYILSATINNAPNVNSATITTTKGLVTSPPLNTASGSYSSTDRNGNILSADSSGHFYDTLSSTTPVLTVAGSGTPASPYTFTYTAPSGGSVSYTMKFTTYSIRTNFACSGITDYGTNGTTTANLVSEIDLPNSSKYMLSYEPTPGHSGFVTGRLASITLPQGGTISYSYSGGNNGINCSDGSTATLQRTTPDGAWTYAQVKGTGAASTTTQTDPQGNQTVIQFQGIYETQRQSYKGSTSGTLLQTINTCYNGATSPCTSTAITLPIATRTITTTLPGSANLEAQHVYKYSATGSLTEQDDYDWGSGAVGPLLKKTAITYASLTKISSFRQQVTVTNGVGTVISQTNYNYGDTVTATSGTPQHTTASGSRGNLLSVNYYTNGSTYLTKSMSYFDTGNVQTATDVNGAQTTYTYGACGNSFPTNVAEPLSLSRSMTWNCTGGVQLTSVDENTKTTTTAYNDPYFWRPASVTDPTTAVTNLTYTGQTEVEASLSFNSGSSAQDVLATGDGLGRPHLSQIRETPGGTNFDSTETDYDSDGRPNRVTLPYVGTAGQTNASAPSTNTTYDALGRVLSISDNSGGTRTYSYAQNTVYVTRGPAPSGENTKRRQEQYDALGRLTSVCEVTAGTTSAPAGTCVQTVSQTGYWTKYTYDALGRLTGVTQNAQSGSTQTRTYLYDLLGRLTSETNPESGMNTYVYDTDSTMCGNGAYTSNGDLVKTTDNVGNCVMRYYDSLHRLTDVGNNHQSATNPCKRFRYDNTSGYPGSTKPSGLTNLLGRLAEVETDSGSLITDEWFSYTVRGEVSDFYESTPHSGGYYHTSATYWANGVINQLNAPGQYYAQYNVDGEGRISSTAPSVGALSGTTYNAASQPTQVTFASGDSDAFTYDPNTGRMTQYKFTINGQSLVGNLTWNADHTLASQNITDPFDSSDQQNCSYTHDDLTRLASVNCGSILSQTFSYDAFGNISKTGTYQFQPTYNSATNRYASIPGTTVSYDNDGNVLSDGSHK